MQSPVHVSACVGCGRHCARGACTRCGCVATCSARCAADYAPIHDAICFDVTSTDRAHLEEHLAEVLHDMADDPDFDAEDARGVEELLKQITAGGSAEVHANVAAVARDWISEVAHGAGHAQGVFSEPHVTLDRLLERARDETETTDRTLLAELAMDPLTPDAEVDFYATHVDRQLDALDALEAHYASPETTAFRDLSPEHQAQLASIAANRPRRGVRRRARRRRRKRKQERREDKAARSRRKEREARLDREEAEKEYTKAKKSRNIFTKGRRKRAAKKKMEEAKRRERRAGGKAEDRERKAARTKSKLAKTRIGEARPRVATRAGTLRYMRAPVAIAATDAPGGEGAVEYAYDASEFERDVDAPALYAALLSESVHDPQNAYVSELVHRFAQNVANTAALFGAEAAGDDDHEMRAWCRDAAQYLAVEGRVYRARLYARLLVPGGRARLLKKLAKKDYDDDKLEDIIQVAESLAKRSRSKKREAQWAELADAARAKKSGQ